jgi:CRISPR-associated protein (Cas_Cas02710)
MKKPHILLDPSNFWLWLLQTLPTGILVSVGGSLLQSPKNLSLRIAFVVLLLFVIFLGLIFSARVRKAIRENRRFLRVEFPTHVSPAKALIVFVSKAPGSSSALEAALHHATEGHLKDFWMIASEDSADEAKRIGDLLKSRHPQVQVHPPACISDINSIPEAKMEVENLRGKCRKKYDSSEIVCDFTGLTKSMSAGMILACAPRDARLQYMHPNKYLPNGYADVAAGSHAVEVKIAYQIDEDEDS